MLIDGFPDDGNPITVGSTVVSSRFAVEVLTSTVDSQAKAFDFPPICCREDACHLRPLLARPAHKE